MLKVNGDDKPRCAGICNVISPLRARVDQCIAKVPKQR